MGFEPRTTYLVESKDDPSVLLALEVRVEEGRLMWFDTVRDRSLRVEAMQDEGDVVTVRAPKGSYRFSPLTLERYRLHVRGRVEGRPEFFSDEDVQDYYRQFPS